MKRTIVLFVTLLVATPTFAKPWKTIVKFVEHAALGAGVGAGTAYAAGGPQHYWAGLSAAGSVAGFKEGTEAHTGRICNPDGSCTGDTRKMAAWHAVSILAGEVTFVLIKHSQGINPPNPLQPIPDLCHHR